MPGVPNEPYHGKTGEGGCPPDSNELFKSSEMMASVRDFTWHGVKVFMLVCELSCSAMYQKVAVMIFTIVSQPLFVRRRRRKVDNIKADMADRTKLLSWEDTEPLCNVFGKFIRKSVPTTAEEVFGVSQEVVDVNEIGPLYQVSWNPQVKLHRLGKSRLCFILFE